MADEPTEREADSAVCRLSAAAGRMQDVRRQADDVAGGDPTEALKAFSRMNTCEKDLTEVRVATLKLLNMRLAVLRALRLSEDDEEVQHVIGDIDWACRVETEQYGKG